MSPGAFIGIDSNGSRKNWALIACPAYWNVANGENKGGNLGWVSPVGDSTNQQITAAQTQNKLTFNRFLIFDTNIDAPLRKK